MLSQNPTVLLYSRNPRQLFKLNRESCIKRSFAQFQEKYKMSAIDQMQLIKLSLSISARGQRSYKKAHYQEQVSTFSGHRAWTVRQVLNIDTQSELKRHQDPTQQPQLVGPQTSKPLTSPNNSKEARFYLAKVKVTVKYFFLQVHLLRNWRHVLLSYTIVQLFSTIWQSPFASLGGRN